MAAVGGLWYFIRDVYIPRSGIGPGCDREPVPGGQTSDRANVQTREYLLPCLVTFIEHLGPCRLGQLGCNRWDAGPTH